MNIRKTHPRYVSLRTRERLVRGMRKGVVVPEGLVAHGRGEAFDYIMGEKTLTSAKRATKAAAAQLLLAKRPVISVNGNVAALVPRAISQLESVVPALVEVNLFHRTLNREKKIASQLRQNGVRKVLGIGDKASAEISGISSSRRRTDPLGIQGSDVVLVPLEDGDRVTALRKIGKTVIAIDLNPLSRTARAASITIVDNVVRALPSLVSEVRVLKSAPETELQRIIMSFDNSRNLGRAIREITGYLGRWASR
ncbi:MAG TPA: phosphopantothenate/pantothenate synthetase [Candidatus Bathyarchaeia archaeon]